MTGKIPRAFIDDLISRVDIVSLIDARIPLRKKGANYSACCPFHQEKTPSFTVNQQKQMFYCFGCGVGGNSIRFLMEYERLGFLDALEVLAREAGISLPTPSVDNNFLTNSLNLYEVTSLAANYYHAQLRQSPAAIQYLKGRGISGEIAKDYYLGFAPAGWDNLMKQVPSSSQALLLQAGLQIQKETGRAYDRFRDRVMFPIRDTQGRVIGFGGRVLNQEEPKYLNSPETPLFHKGKELYGLYEARRAIRDIDCFIVVEGYMDVIALAQHGIRHVVGTLGTATTAEHLTKLLRYTQKIVFCFDGDRAGREAAWRALQVALPLLNDGVQLSFMFLPAAEDPDSFIRLKGKEVFLEEVEKAQSLSEFLFKHVANSLDLSNAEGKAALSRQLAELINKMPEGVLKQMMYARLQRIIPLPSEKIRSLTGGGRAPRASTARSSKFVQPTIVRKTPMQLAVMLLLHYPALHRVDLSPFSLEEWDLPEVPLFRELVQVISNQAEISTAQLLELWRERPESKLISALLMEEYLIEEAQLESEFLQILSRIQQQHRQNKIEKILFKGKTQGLSNQEKLELQALISSVKA